MHLHGSTYATLLTQSSSCSFSRRSITSLLQLCCTEVALRMPCRASLEMSWQLLAVPQKPAPSGPVLVTRASSFGPLDTHHHAPTFNPTTSLSPCNACRLERQPTSSDSTREASASTASSAAAAPSCNSPPTQQQQQQPPIAKPSTRLLPVPAICAGASIVLPTPPARQRSEQLQQRLAQLQDQADARQYASMVADITQDEQQAAAALSDPFFPTTKLQLSFGLHVIVTMGTFFALGFYGGRLLTRNDSWVRLSCVRDECDG